MWLAYMANHGFTIVSFPPTHKANNENAHTGHKQRWMADGGIGGGRCCRRCLPSSFVDNVFDGGGALLLSDRGHIAAVSLLVFIRRRHVTVRLPKRQGQQGDNEEDEDDVNNDDANNNDDLSCRGSIPLHGGGGTVDCQPTPRRRVGRV